MADRGAVDGKTKVYWVTTIANKAAPTTAELDAGTALDGIMTPDGMVGFQADTNEVDNSSFNSTFNSKQPGRANYSGTMLRFKKQTATDTVFDLLDRDTTGYVVVRRGSTASTAWAGSDKVEVYPATCGEVRLIDPEPDTMERYEVPIFISAEPSLRATVSASS